MLKALKGRRSVNELRYQGRKIWVLPWLVVHWHKRIDGNHICQIGFVVRRSFLNAVKKNRLKRVFRSHCSKLISLNPSFSVLIRVTRKIDIEEWKYFNDPAFQKRLFNLLKKHLA